MAPESALNQPYDESIDMYSYGLILYEVMTGCAPYTGLNSSNMIEKVFLRNQRPSFEYDDFGRQVRISEPIRRFLEQCWSPQPSLRPKASTAEEFFTNLEMEANVKKSLQRSLTTALLSAFSKKDTIKLD